MYKYILLFSFFCFIYDSFGQKRTQSITFYIEAAKKNSPLLKDYVNQQAIEAYEQQRLKAFYTHSKLELNGSCLFVPVISKDDGRTSFQWDAQNGSNYYGYDLSTSSTQLLTGLTWNKSLTGNKIYQAAYEQTQVRKDLLHNHVMMEEHQLERSVTEQYILCLLDKQQLDFSDSIEKTLDKQEELVRRLAANGMSKQSDLHLIAIEKNNNEELAITSQQSYHSHLIDLNIICGIADTDDVNLLPIEQQCNLPVTPASSAFIIQYQLDRQEAMASYHSFNTQYTPQVSLFVDGGLRTSLFHTLQKRMGISAGATFSWILSDGKQRHYREQQMQTQLNSIQNYQEQFTLQNTLRLHKYREETKAYDNRLTSLKKEKEEYVKLLVDYQKEIQVGQRSLLDYIVVLRNRIQAEKDYLLLQTNKQLLLTTYNYWNW